MKLVRDHLAVSDERFRDSVDLSVPYVAAGPPGGFRTEPLSLPGLCRRSVPLPGPDGHRYRRRVGECHSQGGRGDIRSPEVPLLQQVRRGIRGGV